MCQRPLLSLQLVKPHDPGSQAQGDRNSQPLPQDTPQRQKGLQRSRQADWDSGLWFPTVPGVELALEPLHTRTPRRVSQLSQEGSCHARWASTLSIDHARGRARVASWS